MGHGTFGQVFLAVYKPSGTMCAAKIQDIDGDMVTREVELLRALRADVHVDVAADPPRLLLFTELCDLDLRRYLKSKGGQLLGPPRRR